MQGFIHLLLEAYASETIGAPYLRQIRQLAGVQGPPLATHYYPDHLTMRLFQAVADYQGVALDEILYQFGVYFMRAPLMRQNYRAFLEGHTSARSFLDHVPLIHRQLGRAFKEAHLPELRYVNHAPDLLEIIYTSPRRLCHFLRGTLTGVSQYFHEPLEIREIECQHRGASACRIVVRFPAVRRSGPMPEYPSLAGAGSAGTYQPISAPGPGPQRESIVDPLYSPAQMGASVEAEARRKREEEEDLLILHTLSSHQTIPSRAATSPEANKQPLDVALSLFEIAHWIKASGAAEEYSRLSLIQRSLTRLTVQGFVEAKRDPHALRQHAPAGVAALGGQGVLAAQRYRITPAGQAWLHEMQQRRR